MHTEVHDRLEQAQAELTLHRGGVNSSAIVESLWAGLTTLRKLCLARLHPDSDSPLADSFWRHSPWTKPNGKIATPPRKSKSIRCWSWSRKRSTAGMHLAITTGFAIGCCGCVGELTSSRRLWSACNPMRNTMTANDGGCSLRFWSKRFPRLLKPR